jgi:hypothetical protein
VQQTSWWRKLSIGALLGVAGLAFAGFVPVHWAERQIFNTDNWVALVSPIPKEPSVYQALGNYITDQIFDPAAVQQKVSDALPPRAAFLAGPLTGQLKSLTTKASQKLVAGDAFQAIWTGANRVAMNRLLSKARGQTPPLQAKIDQKFDINLSGTQGKLSQAMGKAADAIPALQPASQKVLDVSTDLKARPRRVQQVVKTSDFLWKVLPMLSAAALLSALAISKNRRRTALTALVLLLVLMLLELIAIKWLRQATLSQVKNSANLSAVSYIYDSLVAWLRHMIYWVVAFTAILAGLLALGGPARFAQLARQYLRLDKLHGRGFIFRWQGARIWLRHYEYYFWLAAALGVLTGVAVLSTVNGRVAINALLLIVSLVALVHIIATPPSLQRVNNLSRKES